MIITALIVYIVLISALAYWLEHRIQYDVYVGHDGRLYYKASVRAGQLITMKVEWFELIKGD